MIALLVPSRGRFWRLYKTLNETRLRADCRFFVVANYSSWKLWLLRVRFGRKAVFIDERSHGTSGMIMAYNLAFQAARNAGATYAALWADDLTPQKKNWLDDLEKFFIVPKAAFGIFSSDECHKTKFGWNFFGGIPNAHFFIAHVDALGDFFLNPKLNAYVGDYEVCVRMTRAGIPMTLLPIRVDHFPTVNKTRSRNAKYYALDLGIFDELYPELAGVMYDAVVTGDYGKRGTFVRDTGRAFAVDPSLPFISYDDLITSEEYAARDR